MANLNADIRLLVNATQSGDHDFGGPTLAANLDKLHQLTFGTLANQCDLLFADTRTLAASTNDDIDLAGVLTSAFGTVINFAEIVGIIIASDAANTTTLTVGAGTNPWITMWLATGDGIKVFPGGTFMNIAPDANGLGAVTAATADILRIANGAGGSATYRIMIFGRSA
jgi:hypothetical protein